MSFLNSLLNNSKKFDEPFTHWELNQPLSEGAMQEIVNADIVNPNDHDFFVPLNISYIIKKYADNIEVGDFEIENHKDEKELSFYEIDRESKRYVFCPTI